MEVHPRDVAEYLRRIAQDLDDCYHAGLYEFYHAGLHEFYHAGLCELYHAGLCERVAQIVLDDWALKVAARSPKEIADD